MKMDLQERLGYETLSGILAAGIVSPFITIIDKSITANASGRQKLLDGIWSEIKLLMTHPIKFVKRKEFLLIWCVYSGTYITANTIEAVCDNYDVSHYYPKFIGTSAVNITLGILKDKSFTKMFGVGPAKHFPKISYLCFAARDSVTIFASFNLTHSLSRHFVLSQEKMQMAIPCVAQAIASPLYLAGLDFYNHPKKRFTQRVFFMRKEYLRTTLARVARILPAYGIGGILNSSIREKLW